MSGFLGILDAPVPTPHLQELIDEIHAVPTKQHCCSDSSTTSPDMSRSAVVRRGSEPSVSDRIDALLGRLGLRSEQLPDSELSARVDSVVVRLEALTKPKDATAGDLCGGTETHAGATGHYSNSKWKELRSNA